MENTRRDFIRKTAAAAAGTWLGTMGMSAKSYGNIIGANDRVRVGVIGFSDRFKNTLFPCFLNHYKELNFDIVALSDLWSYRRDLGAAHLKSRLGHDITACRNNDELYNLRDLD
ncbi:MAG: twin-arginine translocation signal domain-containing protein, partial [Bacteroidetes bacterium]|nr:twin-arginine translocation signal domain-containing protein [Bacteroidota bacterium]